MGLHAVLLFGSHLELELAKMLFFMTLVFMARSSPKDVKKKKK